MPEWTSDAVDLLENQVVQFYNAHPTTSDDALIAVSDIPGSTPFPEFFGKGLLIENNKVHIGGMTDVYLKAGKPLPDTTSPILMQPEDPETTVGFGGEIVVQSDDGVVNPSIQDTHFYSAELEAALTTRYGAAPRPLENLVLEIIDPPSTQLQPTHFRIIHSVLGGVKIDGSFPGSLGLGFENLRFRVLSECSTNISNPLIVLKKGDDLQIKENSLTAYAPSGFVFSSDPTKNNVYLYVDSGKNRGEYRIY